MMIWRVLLSLAAGFGAVAGLNLSLQHIQTGETCPVLGPLPACYLVLAGYSLVLASAWLPKRVANWAFWIGWAPIVGLALTGTTLELIQGDVCPRTDTGVPQCFISLSLAVALLVLWLAIGRSANKRGV